MKFIRLKGKISYARGKALGKMIKNICVHNLPFLEQKLSDEGLNLEYGLKLAIENEKAISNHFPELLDEIHGIADGAQLTYESILLETAYPFTVKTSSKCTIICAFRDVTPDRMPIVGRNYDFLLTFQKCNQLRIVDIKEGGFSFVGGTVTILGVEEGMNNAGLFIGDAGWEPRELPPARGLSSRQIMQLALESCDSVDEAIDFINGAPKFGNNAGTMYLIADEKEAVIMEMGLKKSCLRMSEEGILVASNVFLTPTADEVEPPERKALERSHYAREILQQNKGKVDLRFVRCLLSDHHVPICNHNEINTLRSIIVKTNEGKIIVSDGHPCASEFKQIYIPR